MSVLAASTAAGWLSSAAVAGASVPQGGGNDVAAWQPGWSWTYDTTFVANTSSADVTMHETETYTVAGVVAKDGYGQAYQLNISGTITSCSGSAQGYSISNCSGSASGTAWYETGNLALIEEDQSQNISGTVDSFVGVTASFNVHLQASPALAITDFRLHGGDAWHIASTVAETGNYSYNASVTSGSGPINGSQPIDATATVSTGTVNEPIAGSIAVDQVSADDSAQGVTLTADWAAAYHNLAYLNLDMRSSGIDLTQSLAAASTPTPGTTLSESVSPDLSCAGGPVTVSGALGTGLADQPVTVTTDEEQGSPGTLPSTSTTTGAGGAYRVTVTAPSATDGLQKPGIRGAWGILVTSGSTRAAATLEVTPQDCTTVRYTGATSGPQGSTATVTAAVTDLATGGPASGVPVTFSLSGQSATATATTGTDGVAAATLPLAGPPASGTLTVTTAATSTEAASSTTAGFSVTTDASQVTLTSSAPEATAGDAVTFTAAVGPSGPSVAAAPTGTVQFAVDGADLGSPVPLAGGSATSQADTTMADGTHTVTATYSGDGNYAANSASLTQRIHPPLTATSTSLSATPTSAVTGQAVALTATVSAASGTPDGQVVFSDGATTLGTATLDGTAGDDQASLAVTGLPPGNDEVTAAYQGDGFVTFAASTSAPVDVTVAKDPTTVVVALASPSSVPVANQGLTYQVTVTADSPGAGTPTGTVSLQVDGDPAGSATLQGGSASVPIDGLGAGTHTVTVAYGGDTGFAGSTGSLDQPVDRAATATTLETSPDPSVTGEQVSITATVSPVAPGAGDPTGLVTFSDGTTTIGSAALAVTADGDQATIGLASLPQGSDPITAVYGGDGNFTASTSAAVTQTVDEAPPTVSTTTTLSSTANPSAYGQAVTFTATVSAGDGSTPSGTVQFSVDGTDLGGPVGLDGQGRASSPPIASLAAGGHTVVAAYSGATTPTAAYSVSGAVGTQQVTQATVRATPAATPDPAPYGSPVTLGVTLSAVAPGAGTPGGTVQFLVDGHDVGDPVPASAGAASIQDPATLAPGAHTLSVVTSGDADFAGAGASAGFTVSAMPTTTALVAAPTSTEYGQPVTLTATVTPAQADPAPTGQVQFSDGTASLGTVAVAAGSGDTVQAVLTTTALDAGTHAITATYTGDAAHATSTSPAVTVTVAKAPTAISATPAAATGGTLTATLTNTATGGTPIAGQPLEFAAGSTVLCAAAVTDAQGVASCPDSDPLAVVLAGGYTVLYHGSADYLGYGVQEGAGGQGNLGTLVTDLGGLL